MAFIKRVWISGSDGRLGRELARLLNPEDIEIIATDKEVVDITKSEEVAIFVDRNRPHIIINCSAITDPEYCENHPEEAFLVNGLGARNLAVSANRINAKLIHLSTDDVFNGEENILYKEYDRDKIVPSTIYGKSKLFGEKSIEKFSTTHFIIRSSWLYGRGNKTVENYIEIAKKGEVIKVPKEQYAAPTSAYELAKFISFLMHTYEYGTYHAVCQGSCSRKEFAEEVLKIAGVKGIVVEDEGHENQEFRPNYTILDDFLLRISGIYKFPHWKDALRGYIENMDNTKGARRW